MPMSRDLRSRPVMGALFGLLGVLAVDVPLIAFDPEVTRAVPLLLLLIPVTATSVLAGWKASVPVAVVTGTVYAFAFVAPRGVMRIGLTEDTVSLVTFVTVAVLVSLLAGLAGGRERERGVQRAVLLRTVSHDLRTPIGTIRAASAELRDGTFVDPGMQAELLGLVVDEAERLDRIVGNLLSMSRVEAGALSPDRSPEELSEIVSAAVRRLRRTGGPTFVVCVSDELPEVYVDRTQMDQVITNLLENAVRHGGGATIDVDAVERGRWVELTVTDHGPGFAAAAKAHAFDFFHHSGTAGSAGIGLAVCKAIVEAHGGTIRVGDGPDGGARVSLTIETAR